MTTPLINEMKIILFIALSLLFVSCIHKKIMNSLIGQSKQCAIETLGPPTFTKSMGKAGELCGWHYRWPRSCYGNTCDDFKVIFFNSEGIACKWHKVTLLETRPYTNPPTWKIN